MIGQTISHYRIVEKLGAGGMGEVFRAEDTRLGRGVALKFLPESAAKNEQALERFTRESRAAAALNHPNICTLYDVGQHEGRPYIAMELMKGRNLHRHLSGRPLSLATILELSIQMTDALDTAHRAGIIHRDIKPGNLFVTDRGQIKVLDFGLAKLAGSGASGGTEAPTAARDERHLTSPGAAVGTVSYMSPEQARGEEVDTRTDVFSLGVVLYEMATGEQAFGGSSTAVIFEAILNRTPDAPKKLPELPDELQEIVLRAIEKDRDLRYQSAADLRAALKRLSRDRASDAGRDREAPSSDAAVAVGLVTRHKKKMGVTAAVLLAVAFGLFRWLSPAGEGPIRSVAVLPFENAGGDPDTEYLSDGIAESLIDSLSELPELRVAPRGQSFQFRGPAVDLSRVGAELDVRALVTGRVQQRGETLVVRADLVDLERNAQIWGEQYDREIADILTLQRDLSRAISDSLRLRLTGELDERLTRRGTSNDEAYRLFLRGRHLSNKATPESVPQSIEIFRQVLDLDPSYAAAYAGLANSYRNWGYGYAPGAPVDVLEQARSFAERALELDEELAQAHVTLGSSRLDDWDWPAAERAFERAMELDPDSATAHQLTGAFLSVMGKREEGALELLKALELDPLHPHLVYRAGVILGFSGRTEEAIAQVASSLELAPDLIWARRFLADLYSDAGMVERALSTIEEYYVRSGATAETLAEVREALAREGWRGYKAWEAEHFPYFTYRARAYASLSRNADAVRALEESYRAHERFLPWFILADPVFDPLHDEPGFQEILRLMDLPH